MRAASLLRRGLWHAQRRGQKQLAHPPEKRTGVREFDEEQFGGWKGARMLFVDEPKHASVIGRADWHIVQFLLALVPPGMALLLIEWARYDMQKTEQQRATEMLEKESQRLAAVAKHQQSKAGAAPAPDAGSSPAAGAAASSELLERLARLESLVQDMQRAQPAQQRQQQQPAAVASAQQGAPAPMQQPGSRTEDAEQEEQQQGQDAEQPSLAAQVAGTWRWLGSWIAPGSPGQPAASTEAAAAPALAPAAATQSSSSSEAAADAGSSGASIAAGQPAQAHAAAAEPSPQEAPPVPEPAAGAGPAAPGNAANGLLHAMGRPLRWLRHKRPQPGAKEAELDGMIHSWLKRQPGSGEPE